MARSARAFAQSPTVSTQATPALALSAVPVATNVAALPVTEERSAASLALDALNEAHNLRDVHRAYAGLEKLLSTFATADSQAIHATRDEFGSLLRVLGDALLNRIDVVDAAIEQVHVTLREGGAQ